MMTTTRLLIYVGLLLGMLLPVLLLAVQTPSVPHVLVALLFVLLIVPLIRRALRLHRDRAAGTGGTRSDGEQEQN